MSQSELADALHISRQSIYKYEADLVSNISDSILQPMAELLHTTPQYLVGPLYKKSANSGMLSETEQQLLALFRLIPDADKEMVTGMVEVALKSKGLL